MRKRKESFSSLQYVYKTEAPTSHFVLGAHKKDKTKAFVGCSVSLIKDSFDKPVGFEDYTGYNGYKESRGGVAGQ